MMIIMNKMVVVVTVMLLGMMVVEMLTAEA
jgi:hypothetical protein